ncbi:hypothetical protein LNQ49_00825 [Flavobacterium sp. F-65]|jgi:hypothetical protein|uniref:SMODS and SLOG-associating 2TM effector domain-containing protein n=1 Tax=Flavobacterium pisciphilum TaxID=2893755 RepID=A0ABS8MN00_9FLAO|nr:hypothetical protein [Flavobacterium sp. F-65]MCC9070149.1 hypothetical protein [Flavobacterium sp. F-65]
MRTIKQRRLFTKKEYNILDNKLHYKTSYIGGESEGIVAFENLSKEKMTYKSSNSIILLISILFYGIAGIGYYFRDEKDSDPNMWIASTCTATILLIIYFTMNENSWKIRTHNNGYIYLLKNKPNKNIVDDFITTLFNDRDNYLIEKYLNLDPNLSYETQVNDLKWLLTVEAITKTDFDKNYQNLKLLYAPKKGTIGF